MGESKFDLYTPDSDQMRPPAFIIGDIVIIIQSEDNKQEKNNVHSFYIISCLYN